MSLKVQPARGPEAVSEAVRLLKAGGVIALPTDTLYGIAAHSQANTGVERLYSIKNRSRSMPIALCCSQPSDLPSFANTQSLPHTALSQLLPGPYTLILPTRDLPDNLQFADSLTRGLSVLGFRVPRSEFARCVCEQLGSPIALTSANFSGDPSPVECCEFEPMHHLLDMVFDGGRVGDDSADPTHAGSTVIDLSAQPGRTFKVLRPGAGCEAARSALSSHGLHEESNENRESLRI